MSDPLKPYGNTGTDHVETYPDKPKTPPRPETTHFQTLVNVHGQDASHMVRIGKPTTDLEAATAQGLAEMEKHNVKECFIVTVHAAFTKEVNITKAI